METTLLGYIGTTIRIHSFILGFRRNGKENGNHNSEFRVSGFRI